MKLVDVNGRWPVLLLDHRAARPEWPYWEAHRLALAHSLIERGSVVWEIGAEEGDYPALYATWGADVVAVEPNPFVWPQIKAHWEANVVTAKRLDHNPKIYPVVGMASNVTVEAADYDEGWTDGWPNVAYGEIKPDHGFRHIWEHASVSPQLTLDDLLQSGEIPPPDLICIDIEGGEYHALDGAPFVLNECRPNVLVSIHPDFLNDLYDLSRENVLDVFDDAGYEYRLICIDHEEHWLAWPKENPPISWG